MLTKNEQLNKITQDLISLLYDVNTECDRDYIITMLKEIIKEMKEL